MKKMLFALILSILPMLADVAPNYTGPLYINRISTGESVKVTCIEYDGSRHWSYEGYQIFDWGVGVSNSTQVWWQPTGESTIYRWKLTEDSGVYGGVSYHNNHEILGGYTLKPSWEVDTPVEFTVSEVPLFEYTLDDVEQEDVDDLKVKFKANLISLKHAHAHNTIGELEYEKAHQQVKLGVWKLEKAYSEIYGGTTGQGLSSYTTRTIKEKAAWLNGLNVFATQVLANFEVRRAAMVELSKKMIDTNDDIEFKLMIPAAKLQTKLNHGSMSDPKARARIGFITGVVDVNNAPITFYGVDEGLVLKPGYEVTITETINFNGIKTAYTVQTHDPAGITPNNPLGTELSIAETVAFTVDETFSGTFVSVVAPFTPNDKGIISYWEHLLKVKASTFTATPQNTEQVWQDGFSIKTWEKYLSLDHINGYYTLIDTQDEVSQNNTQGVTVTMHTHKTLQRIVKRINGVWTVYTSYGGLIPAETWSYGLQSDPHWVERGRVLMILEDESEGEGFSK